MSREKEIADLSEEIYRNCHACLLESEAEMIAEFVIEKQGYRKQIEAEWVWNPDGLDWGLGAWQCSKCCCKNDNLPYDKSIKPLLWAGSKFCPQCGAKMKGD